MKRTIAILCFAILGGCMEPNANAACPTEQFVTQTLPTCELNNTSGGTTCTYTLTIPIMPNSSCATTNTLIVEDASDYNAISGAIYYTDSGSTTSAGSVTLQDSSNNNLCTKASGDARTNGYTSYFGQNLNTGTSIYRYTFTCGGTGLGTGPDTLTIKGTAITPNGGQRWPSVKIQWNAQ